MEGGSLASKRTRDIEVVRSRIVHLFLCAFARMTVSVVENPSRSDTTVVLCALVLGDLIRTDSIRFAGNSTRLQLNSTVGNTIIATKISDYATRAPPAHRPMLLIFTGILGHFFRLVN